MYWSFRIVTASFYCLLFIFYFSLHVHAQSGQTKLGIYAVADKDLSSIQSIASACPPVFKVHDPHKISALREAMRTYKTDCPQGVVIIRLYVDGRDATYTTAQSGESAADDFFSRIREPLESLKASGDIDARTYISGPNEYDNTPPITNQGAVQWYGAFWTRFSDLTMKAGGKPIIGEMLGNFGPTEAGLFSEALASTFQDIAQIDSQYVTKMAWGHHAYGYTQRGDTAGETDHALIYRKIYDGLLQRGLSSRQIPPLYLTEVGAEHLVTPKENPTDYMAWIEWFDGEILKDPYVAAGTIFQIGSYDSTNWGGRDIAPVSSELTQYFSTRTGVEPQIPISDPGTDTSVGETVCPTGWGETIFGRWWTNFTSEDVPEDVTKVADAHLPPRNISVDCVDRNRRGAVGSHSYKILSSQVGKEIVQVQPDAWWGTWNLSLRSIFDEGNKSAGSRVEAGIPPSVNDQAATSGDTRVLGWFSWLFPEEDARSTLGLCEMQRQKLPPGLCCDEKGKLFSCRSTDHQPIDPEDPGQEPIPPGIPGSPGGGAVGKCAYLDEQDPQKEKASFAKTSPCSIQKLAPYFGGDMVKAKNASMVCVAESGGDEFRNINDRCLPDSSPDKMEYTRGLSPTQDYSVGYFQINLLAHCPGALRNDWKVNKSCTILDRTKLFSCRDRFSSAEGSIKEMLRISSNGTNWNPWSVSSTCGLRDWKPGSGTGGGTTSGNYVYYSQQDPQFADLSFGSCTVKRAGCLPVSVSMILSSNGVNLNPKGVADEWVYSKGEEALCSGYVIDGLNVLKKHGFTNQNNQVALFHARESLYPYGKPADDTFKSDIKKFLNPGCGVIALAYTEKFWHFFWIAEIDSSGTMYTMDPWWGWDAVGKKPYPFPKDISTISSTAGYRGVWAACKP